MRRSRKQAVQTGEPMNSEPISEQARKCLSEIERTRFTSLQSEWLAIIQRHMTAYATEREKELVKDKERLDWLEQNTTSIVAYNKGKKLIDSFIGNQKYRQAIDTAIKGTKAEVSNE